MAFSRFLSPNSTYVTKPDESVILCESLTITSCFFLTFQATCYYVSVLSHRLQYSIQFWLFPSCSSCVLLELKIIYIYLFVSPIQTRQTSVFGHGVELGSSTTGVAGNSKRIKEPVGPLCVVVFNNAVRVSGNLFLTGILTGFPTPSLQVTGRPLYEFYSSLRSTNSSRAFSFYFSVNGSVMAR